MGQFVSTVVKGIDAVANGIASAVSDVTATTAQILQVTQQFTPPVLHHSLIAMDAPSLSANIKTMMTQCVTAVVGLFKTQFGTDPGTNTDNGCVQSYSDDGDVKTVVSQITQDFNNWSIEADAKAIAMMASTIQREVVAKAGKTGVSYGTYNIDSNQSIDWVVGYGTFQITPENKGLVYGFAAQLNGGWKKK